MKTRSVVLLIVAALLVGGAITYTMLREPERPRVVFPNNEAPAQPRRTPNTSDSYRQAPQPTPEATEGED